MATQYKTIDVKYEPPPSDRPVGNITFWCDGSSWDGDSVRHGDTCVYTLRPASDSAEFHFYSVIFWYRLENQDDKSRMAKAYFNPVNASPMPVQGMLLSDISVNPSGTLDFTVTNQSDLDENGVLGMEIAITDMSDNHATKNDVFASRDPQITLRGTDG